jgi:hypothetical protein
MHVTLPTWGVCARCVQAHGWQLGSDDVAQLAGDVMLTTHVLFHNPALIHVDLTSDPGRIWQLCGCGWRKVNTLLMAWHLNKVRTL